MTRVAFTVVLAALAALPARAEDADAQIRSLVRSLGYGAGIHNFKNYVLRGTDEYRVNADKFFTEAEKTIAGLGGSLKDDEKKALDAISGVVKKYHENLAVAQKMIGEGKSITEIDAAVKVDDTPALEGLAKLQAGRTWSALDKLDAALGYGGAIHNFKNYVLRGKEDYRTAAIARFKEVTDQIAALRADKSLDEAGQKALKDIEGVVMKYSGNVGVAQKMISEKKGVAEIDKAVKVDDAPATAALAVLRK